jgi:YesN/AraC family two-component response regulator
MYRYKESETLLSEQALYLQGSGACFKVHYWGAVERLVSNPVHKHSFFEICYVLDGEGEYTDNGDEFLLRKGTHFCSRPNITHQIRTAEGLSIVYVAFELDESRSSDDMILKYRWLADHAQVLMQQEDLTPTALLWRALLLQNSEAVNLPAQAIPSLAHALLLSFLTLYGKSAQTSSVKHQKSNNLLNQAKMFIRDNLAQPLSLSLVAGYLNISGRHLSRLFSSGIHETFTSYVNRERLHYSVHLLLTTQYSLKEIADKSGFSSVHYYTSLFMKEKQLPPGKFRQKALMGY